MFCSNAFRDVFVLPKMLPLGVGALLLHLAAARRVWRGDGFFRMNGMDAGIAAVFIAMLFSTILSIDIPTSLLGPHQGQFNALVPLLLCALIYYGVRTAEVNTEDVSLALLVASIPVSAWAVFQHTGRDGWLGWSIQDGRAGSTFGSPIFLGAFLAITLPIAFSWVWRSGWRSKLGTISCLLCGFALASARSRGGAVSALIGFIASMIIEFELPFSAIVGIAGVLTCVGATAAMLGKIHPASDLARVEVWKSAFLIWKHYPIFGSGPDTFGIAFHRFMTERYVSLTHNTYTIQTSAHNDILQALSTMGIVGLAAYCFFMWRTSKFVFYSCKLTTMGSTMTASLVALFVQAKVNPIPLPILAIGAAILGAMAVDRPFSLEPSIRTRKMVNCLGAAIACAIVALTVRMCKAERYQMLAELARDRGSFLEAAQDYNLAAQVNPLDIHYSQAQLNALWAIMPGLRPSEQLQARVASVILADRICLLHPNYPTAHEIRAVALRVRAAPGDFDEADREIGIAQNLAPTMLSFFQWRAALAVVRHDPATAIKNESRVAQIKRMQEASL